jgi:hypothetical protein
MRFCSFSFAAIVFQLKKGVKAKPVRAAKNAGLDTFLELKQKAAKRKSDSKWALANEWDRGPNPRLRKGESSTRLWWYGKPEPTMIDRGSSRCINCHA